MAVRSGHRAVIRRQFPYPHLEAAMAYQDSAGNIQRIEQTNEVTGRMQ
jgi:hypothetical protein